MSVVLTNCPDFLFGLGVFPLSWRLKKNYALLFFKEA